MADQATIGPIPVSIPSKLRAVSEPTRLVMELVDAKIPVAAGKVSVYLSDDGDQRPLGVFLGAFAIQADPMNLRIVNLRMYFTPEASAVRALFSASHPMVRLVPRQRVGPVITATKVNLLNAY